MAGKEVSPSGGFYGYGAMDFVRHHRLHSRLLADGTDADTPREMDHRHCRDDRLWGSSLWRLFGAPANCADKFSTTGRGSRPKRLLGREKHGFGLPILSESVPCRRIR